ncbi:MAG: R3H domain-containing nucleic acid-binding protein [Parcubacteria group bacterium]
MGNVHQQTIVNAIKSLLQKGGVKATVTWETNENTQLATACIRSSEDLGAFIGKQGSNLSSLEHVVRVMALRQIPGSDRLPHFVVDINNYRKNHLDQIVTLARTVARRVTQNHRTESLSPMTAYERRVIHSELASYKSVTTESTGIDPSRRIIIKPAAEFDFD